MTERNISLRIEISADEWRALEQIAKIDESYGGDVYRVIEQMIAHVAAGVNRPGSHERAAVLQIFGEILC